MKKVCVLFLFALCLLGTNTIAAQNTIEINNAASEVTADLKKQIKFNTDQEHKVYDAYVAYNKSLSQLNQNSNNTAIGEEKKKLYSVLCKSLKTILTDEQYDMFERIEKRNLN